MVSNLSQRTEELFRIPDAEVDENGTFQAPIISLRNNVVFPRMISPVFIEQQENFDSIQYALENGKTAVIMMPKNPVYISVLVEKPSSPSNSSSVSGSQKSEHPVRTVVAIKKQKAQMKRYVCLMFVVVLRR